MGICLFMQLLIRSQSTPCLSRVGLELIGVDRGRYRVRGGSGSAGERRGDD